MKLKYALSMVLLAIVSVFRLGAREEVANSSSAGTHANGVLTLAAEAAFTTRFLLAQKGTAADGIIVNVANTRPLGVVLDEPANLDKAAVALLGCSPGTLKVRASKSIAVGVKVYTTAAGKVTDTNTGGSYMVGRAITAAGADNDIIELAHSFPLLDASGIAL